jgi:hypothetical protein
MADGKQYATVLGTIQWDVEEKEVNGKDIREFSIRSIVSQQLVRVTLWDQFVNVKVQKGDAVIVDGEVKQNAGTDKQGNAVTYNNLTATNIAVIPAGEKVDTPRNVVNAAPAVDVASII